MPVLLLEPLNRVLVLIRLLVPSESAVGGAGILLVAEAMLRWDVPSDADLPPGKVDAVGGRR